MFALSSPCECGTVPRHEIEVWVKVAQIVQGFLTPVIAVLIGVITYRIQRQQARTQQQQAATSHRQHRLALVERRMKVFNSAQELIAIVNREAKIEKLDSVFQFWRDTREQHFLFGAEIGDYLKEVSGKATKLYSIQAARLPNQITRPEHIPVDIEIVEWFSKQPTEVENKFMKYLDFREP